MSTFVYLHGFMSAGKSKKAEDFRKFLGESHPDCRFLAPDIPDDPVRAYRFVTDLLDGIGDDLTGLIGSSLGGFWARVFRGAPLGARSAHQPGGEPGAPPR